MPQIVDNNRESSPHEYRRTGNGRFTEPLSQLNYSLAVLEAFRVRRNTRLSEIHALLEESAPPRPPIKKTIYMSYLIKASSLYPRPLAHARGSNILTDTLRAQRPSHGCLSHRQPSAARLSLTIFYHLCVLLYRQGRRFAGAKSTDRPGHSKALSQSFFCATGSNIRFNI